MEGRAQGDDQALPARDAPPRGWAGAEARLPRADPGKPGAGDRQTGKGTAAKRGWKRRGLTKGTGAKRGWKGRGLTACLTPEGRGITAARPFGKGGGLLSERPSLLLCSQAAKS